MAGGFVVGVLAAYGAAMLWNPPSYEQVIPLLLGGGALGLVAGYFGSRWRGG